MPDTRAAVAVADEKALERQKNQARYIEQLGPQLRRVLPAHIPEERYVRIAINAARTNPKLIQATPLSLAGALMTASVLGLEPNTPTQHCYLVPYENRKGPRNPDGSSPVEAQLIVGYQGFVKLSLDSPQVDWIYGEAVYPEDHFYYQRGTNPYIDHNPADNRPADSQPTHYYAVAILASGARPFVVLTADEVKTLRRGKVGPQGDIPDPQRWMEKKVPIKQLTKLLPKDIRLATAAEADEKDGTALYRDRVKADRMDIPDDVTGELPASEEKS